jgi:hypothetical protein
MNEPTLKTRRRHYRKMLRYFKRYDRRGYLACLGFCYALKEVVCTSHTVDEYPELMKYENKNRLSGYWFPAHDPKPRIDILTTVLDETKPKNFVEWVEYIFSK